MDFQEMARDPRHKRGFEKLLMLAAQRGDADLVAERLGWGIDPNCLTPKGRTPLMANVRSNCPSAGTVEALLKAGANPALVDEAGLTALDYARRKLARINLRPRRKPRKSPSLDENDQLVLDAEEQGHVQELREAAGGDAPEVIRMYWKERLRAARRKFNDPDEVERIVELLEASQASA